MIDYDKWYAEIKEGFSICYCLEPYGKEMLYYGLYHNHIYTDGYKSIKDLVKDFPELKKAMSKRAQ